MGLSLVWIPIINHNITIRKILITLSIYIHQALATDGPEKYWVSLGKLH